MGQTIKVYYTFFDKPLSDQLFDQHFLQLPDREKKKLRGFKRWEDATASMIGKILLTKLLQDIGVENIGLTNIKYTKYNRPFFNDAVDFNITHSGNYVACAITTNGKVGIDIEKTKQVSLSDFSYVLTSGELDIVNASKDQNVAFFDIWTQKEAAVKADGSGLNGRLNEISTGNYPIRVNEVEWWLKKIFTPNGYVMHVAYNTALTSIEQKYIEI